MQIKDSSIKLQTGNTIPVMGIGTWGLSIDTSSAIQNALEIGYKMIDTSSDYGTQSGIGNAIRQSNINRQDIFIVTKVEEMDDSYKRILSNLEELQLDYVDLALIHRPPQRG